jgi:hypothetical protein
MPFLGILPETPNASTINLARLSSTPIVWREAATSIFNRWTAVRTSADFNGD